MIHLGLTPGRHEAFLRALASSHAIRIQVFIHNSDEERVNDFDFHFGTTHVLGGSVDIDATRDISRTLSVSLLDPYRRFRWSPDKTSPGSLYSGDFISVRYGVRLEHHTRGFGMKMATSKNILGQQNPGSRYRRNWVFTPIFWGPLTGYESSGVEVTLEAQGKESLALDPYLATRGWTLHKNKQVDQALRHLFEDIGETRFDLPPMNHRLHADRSIHPRSEIWKIAAGGESDNAGRLTSGIIHQAGGEHPMHLYYNGEGRLTAARLVKDPQFTFDGDYLLSDPDVTYDPLIFKNTVIVNGAKPAGKKKTRPTARVELPRHHPLSPHHPNMTRNGKPRFLTLVVDVDNLKTEAECRQRGHKLLYHHSRVGLNATFDTLPVPMIEELDYVRCRHHDDFDFVFPIKEATIPLTSDQPMTIGDTRPIKAARNINQGNYGGMAGPPGGTGGSKSSKAKQEHA